MIYPTNEHVISERVMNQQTMIFSKMQQLPYQLPNNLKTLALNNDFNQSVDNFLPANLLTLSTGDGFNQPIYSLPVNLKIFRKQL